MQLLHALAKTHASFDDPNLVSHAGLVPVMALADRVVVMEAGRISDIGNHDQLMGRCPLYQRLHQIRETA